MTAITPYSIRLDVSTHCQLKCPSCPTAQGKIDTELGSGFVSLDQFQDLIENNPDVLHVELSNWGESLLNPQLPLMLEVAYRHNVIITISNGANLNTVKPEALEAIVKYRVRQITCSIDGASQETYSQYRINGDFDRVIANIRSINHHKRVHRTQFPILLWQFVAFGHNQQEIPRARTLAAELGMEFYVKLTWDEQFSPLKDPDKLRKEVNSGFSSKSEYLATTNRDYMSEQICKQLFQSPQINWDGRILGCCVNTWGDYGNAYGQPLQKALNNTRIRYAREMLLGKVPTRPDIPCATCDKYQAMLQHGSFLQLKEAKESWLIRLGAKLGRNGIGLLRISWVARKWLEAIILSGIRKNP